MTSRQAELEAKVEATWRGSPETLAVCLAILRFVFTPPAKAHLSLSMLRKGAGLPKGERESHFIAAIQYFLGDAVPLLALRFEVIDDQGFPVRIDDEAARAASEHNIDPLTGEVDLNIANRIIPYFQPLIAPTAKE